ncbi:MULTISPECIES: c-type cytochrome [Cobetia]|uniref:c-type cytochrome n=1 Tax=Cobetia TaxID=204286 RepID=UPI000A01094C|nr:MULTISPECIES: c-type cytochrome [Cobetia]
MQARQPSASFLTRSSLPVSLSAMLFSVLVSSQALAADNSHDAIAERLKPVGELCLKGESCAGDMAGAGQQPSAAAETDSASAASAIDGEKVYGGICMACHTTGAAGAPRLGEASDWEARLAKGDETLYTHAIEGFNAMPAKGGNPALSDEEVKAAVDYLLDSVR